MNDKKGQGDIVTTALVVTVGTVLFLVAVTIAFQLFTDQTTLLTGVTDDLAYTSAPGGAQSFTLSPIGDGLVTASVVLGNITGNLTTLLSAETTGLISLNNSVNGTVTATYTHQPSGFLSGITSTVVSFIAVMIALAALGFVGFLFMNRN